jgi:hypothetical protein
MTSYEQWQTFSMLQWLSMNPWIVPIVQDWFPDAMAFSVIWQPSPAGHATRVSNKPTTSLFFRQFPLFFPWVKLPHTVDMQKSKLSFHNVASHFPISPRLLTLLFLFPYFTYFPCQQQYFSLKSPKAKLDPSNFLTKSQYESFKAIFRFCLL